MIDQAIKPYLDKLPNDIREYDEIQKQRTPSMQSEESYNEGRGGGTGGEEKEEEGVRVGNYSGGVGGVCVVCAALKFE